MKKKVLTILLTVVLFLSAVALGVSSVFRVDEVTVSVTLLSEQGRAQATQIQTALKKRYARDSIFSVDDGKAKALVKEYPYFRLTGFSKKYPNTLALRMVEERETYAVAKGEGMYYILSESGRVLDTRMSIKHNRDGADNLLMKGIAVEGSIASDPSGEGFAPLLAFCQAVDTSLGGIRANALYVEYVTGETPYFLLVMREGVRVLAYDPTDLPAEKGKEAVNKYLSLSDEERKGGKITVYDADAKAFAAYEKSN